MKEIEEKLRKIDEINAKFSDDSNTRKDDEKNFLDSIENKKKNIQADQEHEQKLIQDMSSIGTEGSSK